VPGFGQKLPAKAAQRATASFVDADFFAAADFFFFFVGLLKPASFRHQARPLARL
jgi:hypothetical protein